MTSNKVVLVPLTKIVIIVQCQCHVQVLVSVEQKIEREKMPHSFALSPYLRMNNDVIHHWTYLKREEVTCLFIILIRQSVIHLPEAFNWSELIEKRERERRKKRGQSRQCVACSFILCLLHHFWSLAPVSNDNHHHHLHPSRVKKERRNQILIRRSDRHLTVQ